VLAENPQQNIMKPPQKSGRKPAPARVFYCPSLLLALLFQSAILFAQLPPDCPADGKSQFSPKDSLLFEELFSKCQESNGQAEIISLANQGIELALKACNYRKFLEMSTLKLKKIYRGGDFPELIRLNELTVEVARHFGDSIIMAKAYNNLGLWYRYTADYGKAVENNEKAVEIYRRLQNDSLLITALNNLGNVYDELEANQKSLEIKLQAARIAEKTGNYHALAMACNNIGVLYYHQKNYDLALDYYRRAYEIRKKNNYSENLGSSLNNIGSVYVVRAQLDSAIIFYQQAIEANRENPKSLGYSYNDIGVVYKDKADYDQALSFLEKAVGIRTSINDYRGLIASWINLAVTYSRMGSGGKALEACRKAEELMEKMQALEMKTDLYKAYSEAWAAAGNYKQSNKYLNLAYILRDSLITEQQSQTLFGMETAFQLQRSRDSLEILNLRNLATESELLGQRKMARLWLILGIATLAAFLLAVLFIALLVRRARERERARLALEQKNSQIQMLNRELSHRMKNNLQFVSSLLEMQARRLESQEARKALEESENRLQAMSLLHQKLYQGEEDRSEIALAPYLYELCEHLKNTHLGVAPELQLSVAPLSVQADHAMRLGLIVNELVTNSLKHAFEGVDRPEVRLTIEENPDGGIRLEYRDNGRGLPPDFDPQQAPSLGWKLISTLTRQLRGAVTAQKTKGTGLEFAFASWKTP